MGHNLIPFLFSDPTFNLLFILATILILGWVAIMILELREIKTHRLLVYIMVVISIAWLISMSVAMADKYTNYKKNYVWNKVQSQTLKK